MWPWNAALAFAGLASIAPWHGAPWRSLGSCHSLARPLIGLLLLALLGSYHGVVDPHLARVLYSSNATRARSLCPRGCEPSQQPGHTWSASNVPVPPEHHLHAQARTCGREPGAADPPAPWGGGKQ